MFVAKLEQVARKIAPAVGTGLRRPFISKLLPNMLTYRMFLFKGLFATKRSADGVVRNFCRCDGDRLPVQIMIVRNFCLSA